MEYLNFSCSTLGIEPLFWPPDHWVGSLTTFLVFRVPVHLNPLWIPASNQMSISQGRVLISIHLWALPWLEPIYLVWLFPSLWTEFMLLLTLSLGHCVLLLPSSGRVLEAIIPELLPIFFCYWWCSNTQHCQSQVDDDRQLTPHTEELRKLCKLWSANKN